ncbi:hypothetical protein [Chachezhania antarctica]|uniref:hypothetical protein n=1 Tax=Chachezhania antarctica TaxID=2340860 RepID=UPI000EB2B96E|nr:hypothetical protein [Chachezhania antarctica]|tara:strand:+ start:581 stop:1003 length:423 start_codon:yes stop_codon:yes gene_type:complete
MARLQAVRHLASVLVCAIALLPSPGRAQEQLLAQYRADLGTDDYYTSDGVRHDTLAALLAQDRENYHIHGVQHGHDSHDPIFASADMRRQINLATVDVSSYHAPYASNLLTCQSGCGTFLFVKVFGTGDTITRINIDVPE